eukprot:CAMPEP_0183568940 /NCGR_PEP_ID=MMETSP0371-20130417/118833_1 /TAXON_ID=268820 /ORGANISM="Peridinium aciculiferum, Strain PAER-2" /LENGTH=34 /DNA_ID= /DNA_START= /DNA_END= /DNA_ORIENTATION=
MSLLAWALLISCSLISSLPKARASSADKPAKSDA